MGTEAKGEVIMSDCQDTFKELIKQLPSPKGQRLDKKYKLSLRRVNCVWEPKQREPVSSPAQPEEKS